MVWRSPARLRVRLPGSGKSGAKLQEDKELNREDGCFQYNTVMQPVSAVSVHVLACTCKVHFNPLSLVLRCVYFLLAPFRLLTWCCFG